LRNRRGGRPRRAWRAGGPHRAGRKPGRAARRRTQGAARCRRRLQRICLARRTCRAGSRQPEGPPAGTRRRRDSAAAQLDSAISTETLAAKTLADLEARAGAAAAAQDEQNALADVAGIIEAWTGIAAAEKLLSAAIEAYRAQHQNPLLDRVSEAFAVATGNGFSGISLDFDDADSQRIVAVRADGDRLGVDALSEGTADQLFLALRIATIEDHARRARPLPFVADDLFVTFDDTRTKAG
jgi:uncharacterized protein YhaN